MPSKSGNEVSRGKGKNILFVWLTWPVIAAAFAFLEWREPGAIILSLQALPFIRGDGDFTEVYDYILLWLPPVTASLFLLTRHKILSIWLMWPVIYLLLHFYELLGENDVYGSFSHWEQELLLPPCAAMLVLLLWNVLVLNKPWGYWLPGRAGNEASVP